MRQVWAMPSFNIRQQQAVSQTWIFPPDASDLNDIPSIVATHCPPLHTSHPLNSGVMSVNSGEDEDLWQLI